MENSFTQLDQLPSSEERSTVQNILVFTNDSVFSVINPGTGSEVDLPHAYERGSLMGITAVSIGLSKDVDIAVDAAKKVGSTSFSLTSLLSPLILLEHRPSRHRGVSRLLGVNEEGS